MMALMGEFHCECVFWIQDIHELVYTKALSNSIYHFKSPPHQLRHLFNSLTHTHAYTYTRTHTQSAAYITTSFTHQPLKDRLYKQTSPGMWSLSFQLNGLCVRARVCVCVCVDTHTGINASPLQLARQGHISINAATPCPDSDHFLWYSLSRLELRKLIRDTAVSNWFVKH